MPSPEFLLTSKNVVLPDGMRQAILHIRNGTIAAIAKTTATLPALPVDDVGELVIMPGLVDSHVHINEPGRTDWEGFETATKSAAAGGITTLVDMPLNSTPVTTTADALIAKCSAAQGKLWVDCGFYGGVVPGNTEHIQPLLDAGVLGMKAFLIHSGIDDFPNATEADLRAAMPIIARAHAPLLVHCELTSQTITSELHNPRSYTDYLASRPRQWEHDAINLMIELCREYRCRTHIVHLSAADAVPRLAAARAGQPQLTVETCPHYLYFTAEQIPNRDTRFKCAPPIREHENRELLWNALRSGVIDCIVSDHSPTLPQRKCLDSGDFHRAWGGIASLQLGLSIIWTEAHARRCSIPDVARWMSAAPSALVGLHNRKGALRPGYDADIVVWDPHATFTVDARLLHHRHAVTPYDGATLRGKVNRTYVRGTMVFDGHRISNQASGTILLRKG